MKLNILQWEVLTNFYTNLQKYNKHLNSLKSIVIIIKYDIKNLNLVMYQMPWQKKNDYFRLGSTSLIHIAHPEADEFYLYSPIKTASAFTGGGNSR
jgi:hypothetical protein